CKAACTKALRFNDRKPAVRRRCAKLPAAGFLQERTYHVLGTANVAGRRGAHLDEVFANRMLVVHGVERDHALHVCGRDLGQLGHFRHGLLAHPAAVFLHHPWRGKQCCHPGWIAREEFLELCPARTNEHGLVRLVGCGNMWRKLRPRLTGTAAHLSISPITMSMLALMAITSDSRCPSTIFGMADRFTKAGGRMRQRTGFAVPSDTK